MSMRGETSFLGDSRHRPVVSVEEKTPRQTPSEGTRAAVRALIH